ncbi:MAG: hypothetical protein QOD74_2080 [Variibacter sp.]|nr:hypothetical protein [Variibacter sp.]
MRLLSAYLSAFESLNRHEIIGLTLTLGAIVFAVLTGVLLVRARSRASENEAAARSEIAALRGDVDRAIALLCAEPQVLVIWAADGDQPEILGDAAIIAPGPAPHRTLAFASWAPPAEARQLQASCDALRSRGESFSMMITTTAGRHIEAEGRAVGGRAILRLKEVSGAKRALAHLRDEYDRLIDEFDSLRVLLEAIPAPVWSRTRNGQLAWVNSAYARAVDANDVTDALAQQAELLERSAREQAVAARVVNDSYSARVPAVAAGQRRVFDVLEVPSPAGSAGIGIDVTDVEKMRGELAHLVEAHRRTLDQLSTPVAIFTSQHRLAFSNAAYRLLWDFDPAFLEQNPTDSAILDRLRAARKLPEQTDFRQWRSQLHEAYRALEPKEHWWHLPDGRTLRVVTTPNPDGGITYVFDDLTERLKLERQHDALIRMQGETLDHLAEGVALFGSDGRLRLSNPAFAQVWRLPAMRLSERPHVETIIGWCRELAPAAGMWDALRGAVTGLESREPVIGNIERTDGSVLHCATVPLPDGGTLVTFQDLTDSVQVERALRDRNVALEAADILKNDFVHHVSYELRTPLTNIIGFAHLLHDPATGDLSDKQREYLGYISSSSAALLAIINDILDLASIDAGAMKLDLGPVDIRATMEGAAEGVCDRLTEHGLSLVIRAADGIGSFTGDERRIRQILFNLLSNAVAFSLPGGTITLAAERRDDAIVLSVRDQGRGIPAEIAERVFNRFETHGLGSQHRGTGLGLSIVRSFVELHGGTVRLDSSEGRGTTVTCVFPPDSGARRQAAE